MVVGDAVHPSALLHAAWGAIKELSDNQNKAALGPCQGVIECNAYG